MPAKPAKPVPAATPVAPAAAAPAMAVNVAVNNVNSVIRAFKGDANEHDILKQSVETIADTLNANLTELEQMAAELEAAKAHILELEEKLAELTPPEAEAEEVPEAPSRPVKLEGTPRIGRAPVKTNQAGA
jgi:Skp family chaperone for outer membrane proteins